MRRVVAVAVALLVTGIVLTPVALATDASAVQASGTTTVEDCTTITSSGEYELAGDVANDATSDCIEISADDVVLDGNGHTVSGPGAGAGDDNAVYRGVFVNSSDGVVVRNVVLEGWSPGIRTDGSEATIEDSVVRDGDVGIFLEETGPTELSNVTVSDNDGIGLNTHRTGDLDAVDVTIEGNDLGLRTWDAHGLDLEDSRIVDNDRNGVNLHHHSDLNLTDVTVDGNDGDGVNVRSHEGFRANLRMDGGTVSNNGGNGVVAIASSTATLNGVSVSGNGGLEVAGAELWEEGEQPRGVTASDLAVGPAATTDFENESVGLEPVDADALSGGPSAASPAGDGLNVSGPVTGPVDLELDVDGDVGIVALQRYDGTDWTVVEEDLAVTDGTVEATVDRNGTYAPVESGASDGSGDATPTPTATATPTPTDQDKSKSTPTDTPTTTPGDQDKSKSTPTSTPDDQDKSKATPSDDDAEPTPSDQADSGSTGQSDSTDTVNSADSAVSADAAESPGSSDSTGSTDSDGSTDPDSSTDASGSSGGSAAATPNESSATVETSNATAASGTASTSGGEDRQRSADADSSGSGDASDDVATVETVDEESTFGAGNGFGAVAALLSLFAIALLAHRRR